MKAAVLKDPLNLSVEEVSDPKPGYGEALVEVKSAGICGTDVLIYQGRRKAALPIVLGHEFAGTIVEINDDTKKLVAGDRVFSRGGWACGKCDPCRSGSPELCNNRKSMGMSVDGCMAKYVKVSTSMLYLLPDTVSFNEAQSLVHVACGVNLIHRIRPQLGMNAVLFGPGHAGLIIMQLLRAVGVDRIAVIGGGRQSRLELATKLGADLALPAHSPELVREIKRMMPKGPDIVVECSGSGVALRQAVQIVDAKGVIAVFSVYDKAVDGFEAVELYKKQITITGIRGAGNCSEEASRLLAKKTIKIDPLISHFFSLAETRKAFEIVSGKAADALRVVINP